MDDEATYICDSCGEEIVVPIDVTAGKSQEYVEDCPVCCNPHIVHLEIDPEGEANIWAEPEQDRNMISLCEYCLHVRKVVSGTGSRFLLCQLSQQDPSFQKYPPQPVRQCIGLEKAVTEEVRDDIDNDRNQCSL